jgi:uncharacterized protein YcbK (DUF882 family)
MTRVNDLKLTEHFALREFECPCCHTVKLHPGLVRRLEALRGGLRKPVLITSGYRCPVHNEEVGGVANSAHLLGTAADVGVASAEQVHFRLLAEAAGFRKIICYPIQNFVHLNI